MRLILLLTAMISMAGAAGAAEVTLVPGDKLFLNPTNPGRNYNDLVIQTILVTTGPAETFKVASVRLEFLTKGRLVISKNLAVERLVGETRGLGQMVAAGMGVFLKAQVLSESGLEGLFGRQPAFAQSATMQGDQVLLVTRQHFSFDFVPDEARVIVEGFGQDGAPKSARASVGIGYHQSSISYSAPLGGVWPMTSLPGIRSHHRLNPPKGRFFPHQLI